MALFLVDGLCNRTKFTDVSEVFAAYIILMTKGGNISETSENLYHTKRRSNRGERHLHTRRREKQKSHLFVSVFTLCFKVLSHETGDKLE
jgi:hypothetical protein